MIAYCNRIRIITIVVLFVFVKMALPAQTTITLSVDATEAPRKILHAKESLSVRPGPLTIFYPKWIPGEHGPTGPIADIVGLHLYAGSKELTWRRDLEEMYAIHCEIPEQVTSLDLAFDFVLPPVTEGFSAGASSTATLAVISWNQVVLYPKDEKPDSIIVNPSLMLPAGWKYAAALEVDTTKGSSIHFKSVPLTMLIDSPVLTGEHFRKIDVSAGLPVKHVINLVSEDEASLEMPKEMIEHYERLVREANELFGSHHYLHYDFLFTLSDDVAHFGLEHHQSSDDRVAERALLDDNLRKYSAGLLPHEFVHSWNGKFRRPAGLATGDYSSPMHDDLLWVYEGLTEYLGNLLAARSGLRTADEYRENLAMVAAGLDNRSGRTWRPLQDATDEAQILYEARGDWGNYRRGVDFYDEGDLIWLEVDVRIRELTHGKKSLNDFCRQFYGGGNTPPRVQSYTFDDVVTALDEVVSYDWKSLLTERLQSLDAHAPLGGIEMGGWKLVYRDEPNSMEKAWEAVHKEMNMTYSLGIVIDDDGTVHDILPGSPAAVAGLSPGMKIIALNSRKYSTQAVRDALRKAKTETQSMEFLMLDGEYFKTCSVTYHGGERYPALQQDRAKPDILDAVISPLVKKLSTR